MKKDKILLQLDSLDDVKYFSELGITNFLFAMEGYSIGYKTYKLEELKDIDNAYILVNRLLTDDDIDEFLKIDIPSNIKGFIIEDVGLYEELKERGYTLINFQNHLNANCETVNYWLKYYDSLVISTDITKEEVTKIVEKANKKLVLNTFLYPMIMYSRRKLLSNYHEYMKDENKSSLKINNKNSCFFLKENEYGTATFNSIPLDARSIIDDNLDKNILFYLINGAYLDRNVIEDVINGRDVESTKGFLEEKTVYKVGDLK